MLKFHVAPLASFWQDILSLALVVEAVVGHSDSPSGSMTPSPQMPRMLPANGS